MQSALTYFPDSDKKLQRRMKGVPPPMVLFHDPETGEGPVPGQYQLRISALVFDEAAELDAEFWLDGWTYGLLGTDTKGRDLVAPRIAAVLIPQIVVLIPTYVFLEATLSFLGVGIEGPPTWGTLVVELLGRSSYSDDHGMVLIPLGLLLLTGFAFALVGMGMERYFEPRLRER